MKIAYGNRIWKSRMEIAYVGASFANFDSADLAEILYGNRIWKSYMEIGSCGNRRWKSHMEIAYGNRICRRNFRKLQVGGSCGNRTWKSHMEIAWKSDVGASFANSDSADLAEIAFGNRMEIAYAGASFANSDSADFAKIWSKKCAKTNL